MTTVTRAALASDELTTALINLAAAAEERDERWGVWGGRDRSIRPGRKERSINTTRA